MADQQGGPEGWRAIGAKLLYWPQLERKELKKPRGGPNTDQHMLAHVGGFVYQNNIIIIIVLIKMRIMRMTKCEKLGLAVP